jgi:ribonuclease BN (tRNA processing enzyme)
MKSIILFLLYAGTLLFAQPSVVLQVLGSGGPESGDKRASSSYILWIDGKSKVLVDFGGGAALRFEEAGAKIEDLDVILLTHLHADHTANLPALLKSAFFTDARGELQLFGPKGNDLMPDTEIFINRLFDNKKGAWQYLGDHLDGTEPLQLKAVNISLTHTPKEIYRDNTMHITAISVHHGPIPAIAYRVDIGKHSVTFSGDMSGKYHTLEKLALETDILVMHNAIPSSAKRALRNLHMTPVTIGKIAKKAHAGSVVISHRMLRTLGKERQTQCDIRRNYEGEVSYANDKDKYPFP